MFITQKDLYTKIRQSDLMQIVGDDTTIIEHSMANAVGLVRSYIGLRYDAKKILEATGEAREGLLVSMTVDIAIYEIIALARPNIDITDRRERRNQAIDYLDQVFQYQRATGWPLLPEKPAGSGSSVAYGGQEPRTNYF